MAEIIIFDGTISVPANAGLTNVGIIACGKHIYSNLSGSKPWQLSVYWNGTLLNYAMGSGAYTDSPVVLAAATDVSPGSTNSIRLGWYGDPSMQIRGVNMIVDGNYK